MNKYIYITSILICNYSLLQPSEKAAAKYTSFHDIVVTQTQDIIDSYQDINEVDSNQQTLLHRMVASSNTTATQSVLESGAQTNIQDKDGNTPLHISALTHNIKIVELLIVHGTDPTIKNCKRLTAYSSAFKAFQASHEPLQGQIANILAVHLQSYKDRLSKESIQSHRQSLEEPEHKDTQEKEREPYCSLFGSCLIL